MVQSKKLRVSIVIPVYNEARYLDDCLLAIAAQTKAPHEVIVVNNNSTDETVEIAQRYSFVRLIHEPLQGVVHARNSGFDAARGDIIGRIDADTRLSPAWVASLQRIFADGAIDAVSGAVSYYDTPRPLLSAKLDLFFRSRIAGGMADQVFLYGANMAIRRGAWRRVRSDICLDRGMHEDFDVAIHLYQTSHRNVFDASLTAAVSLRRFNSSPRDIWNYVVMNPRTYALHGLRRRYYMYPVCVLALALYPLFRLMYRMYDADQASFHWRSLLHSAALSRVNPATFVE